MKATSMTSWPSILPEKKNDKGKMTAYPTSRKSRPGVVKHLPSPEPPDDATIRRLNALANKQPFCRLHQVKKHDLL